MHTRPQSPSHTVGGYREFAPPARLASLVDVLWTHEAPRDDPGGARHRVVPEPDVSLAYISGAGDAGPGPRPNPEPLRLVLIGPVVSARFYDPDPGTGMVAVRLKPEWCRPLLGAHPAEHDDALDDLADIDADLAGRLLDRLVDFDSAAGLAPTGDILATLVDAIRDLAARARLSPDSDLPHRGLERLRRAGPTVRIHDVCRDWGVSSRHLRRAVRDATGTSPKRILRAKRLAAALYRADWQADPDWTRIALDCGYYDQSHFIRDCQALAGAAPGVVHAERRAERGGGHGSPLRR